MKQEFPTLVRVFDQTKIKKSYNLFRNLLKQAVMSDTNPEKIKKRDLSIFLTSTVLLQTSEPQKWTSWHETSVGRESWFKTDTTTKRCLAPIFHKIISLYLANQICLLVRSVIFLWCWSNQLNHTHFLILAIAHILSH